MIYVVHIMYRMIYADIRQVSCILECFKNFKNARIPGPQVVLGSPTPDYPEKIFFFGLTPILGKRNVFEILF